MRKGEPRGSPFLAHSLPSQEGAIDWQNCASHPNLRCRGLRLRTPNTLTHPRVEERLSQRRLSTIGGRVMLRTRRKASGSSSGILSMALFIPALRSALNTAALTSTTSASSAYLLCTPSSIYCHDFILP
ncbi:unnamed protein product [Chrysoparadoxa australica]